MTFKPCPRRDVPSNLSRIPLYPRFPRAFTQTMGRFVVSQHLSPYLSGTRLPVRWETWLYRMASYVPRSVKEPGNTERLCKTPDSFLPSTRVRSWTYNSRSAFSQIGQCCLQPSSTVRWSHSGMYCSRYLVMRQSETRCRIILFYVWHLNIPCPVHPRQCKSLPSPNIISRA
jgi:hypothetical protein